MGGGVGGEYGAGVGGRDGLADVGSCVGIGSGLGAGVLKKNSTFVYEDKECIIEK